MSREENIKYYNAQVPVAVKLVLADGSIVGFGGEVISGADPEWAKWYAAQVPIPAKFLLKDGTESEKIPVTEV